ncbi:MAG TPA: thiamine phosphate synthase [Fibrobacteria bacterium]|nr:thiamine phosphate synthase [Fibrobacteria bacterium]HOX50330.1 thiamine phosphate synthase [Fibrobacteria bacterium]
MAIDFTQVHVYLVTDPALNQGRPETEIIRQAARGGLRLVQFRDKTCDARTYLEKARIIAATCRELGVWLLLNDRVDIAACVDCDGVHLGQGDLHTAEARSILGAEKTIGRSTHDASQARQAIREGADYINIGPVFPTNTKQVAVHPVGLDMVREVTSLATVPVTTMGGIHPGNVRDVILAGADRVAVVTAVTMAPDPTKAFADLESLVRDAKALRR